MKGHRRPLIACGMYAFNEELRNAWTSLLQDLPTLLIENLPQERLRAQMTFDSSDSLYQSPNLLLGHTCGYPYIKKWRDTHVPVAVPIFDLPGCSSHEYSCWFVCRADDPRDDVSRFSGAIAAVNQLDSNSGMNMFRYAIKDHANGAPFFSQVSISGSHSESMRMIIRGDADIAAIDAVIYHHAGIAEPLLHHRLRIVGQSAYSPGLPFIQQRNALPEASKVADALNLSLEQVSPDISEILALTGFKPVTDSDYHVVARLEAEAIRVSYPFLA